MSGGPGGPGLAARLVHLSVRLACLAARPARLSVRLVLPVLLAFAAGAGLLWLLGESPAGYYAMVVERGLLRPSGLQAALTRSAPLLFIAAGLMVAFRAGLWNLGVDGQFILAALCTAVLAPPLAGSLPILLLALLCGAVAAAAAALWAVIPAFLRARHGTSEIVSSLMMSFLALALVNFLVKLPFNDPGTTVPQTVTLAVAHRLPRIGGSTVHWGTVLAGLTVLAVHVVLNRTAFGLRLYLLGASPAAARHAGLALSPLICGAFCLSAGLVGLGAAVDMLGVHGTLRANWNPAYGILVIPLVLLARLHGLAVILLVPAFSVLLVGGESAARRLDVPSFFVLVWVAMLLLFFALVERSRPDSPGGWKS